MKHVFLIALIAAGTAWGAESTRPPLTLDAALGLALQQSKAAQLGRLKVDTADAELKGAQRLNFAQVHAYGASLYVKDPLEVKVGRGSLTSVLNGAGPALGLGSLNVTEFPTNDVSLARGSRTPSVGSLSVVQPLTQLWQIGSGVRAARAAVAEAHRESEHINAKLKVAVEELFVGLQVESHRLREKEAMLAWQERRLYDAETAQKSGELLDDTVLGLQAAVIESRSQLTRSRQDYARLSLQLADLIGRSGSDDLVVAEDLPRRDDHPLSYWTAQAANNPERLIAAATLEKATAGVRAARQAYIPEVSLVGGVVRQDGIPLAARDNAMAGVTLSWDVFDFGRRHAQVSRALSQRRAAEVNRDRLEEDATRQLRLAYQDLVFADEQIALARQALAFRHRAADLARQNARNGLALDSVALEADAQLRKAETDLTGAVCQRHLALLHLYFLAGRL
jgi:outer membrane protein TolC